MLVIPDHSRGEAIRNLAFNKEPLLRDLPWMCPYGKVRNTIYVRKLGMSTATLTSKGQTTVPKEIREHLRLRPGDRIQFVIEEDGRVVLVPASFDAADLAGILPRPKRAVSLEEMESAIRRRGARR